MFTEGNNNTFMYTGLESIISDKLRKELTGGNVLLEKRAIDYARARQLSIYKNLKVKETKEVDHEILLLLAVAWLYQYSGDQAGYTRFNHQAEELIRINYGDFTVAKSTPATGAVSHVG
jgi:hypothetical protein